MRSANQGRQVAAKCQCIRGSHGINLVSPFGLILTYHATHRGARIYNRKICAKYILKGIKCFFGNRSFPTDVGETIDFPRWRARYIESIERRRVTTMTETLYCTGYCTRYRWCARREIELLADGQIEYGFLIVSAGYLGYLFLENLQIFAEDPRRAILRLNKSSWWTANVYTHKTPYIITDRAKHAS